jgi:hypothetical protein
VVKRQDKAIADQGDQGPIFRTFFSAESDFLRKIPRNFLEKQFFKTFSAENSMFSQHLWGKIFRGIFPKIFRRKKCTKNRPQIRRIYAQRAIASFGQFFFKNSEVALIFGILCPTLKFMY